VNADAGRCKGIPSDSCSLRRQELFSTLKARGLPYEQGQEPDRWLWDTGSASLDEGSRSTPYLYPHPLGIPIHIAPESLFTPPEYAARRFFDRLTTVRPPDRLLWEFCQLSVDTGASRVSAKEGANAISQRDKAVMDPAKGGLYG
jgi:hypothetical protein